MKNKELFDACTKQCVWCSEQWPILATAGGQMLHVGPYTKDEKLFSISCKAVTIREAFEYAGYRGGKEIEWKAPTPKKLSSHRAPSPDNRKFWRNITVCSLQVSEWPDWKRSMGSSKSTPEELKRMRDELRCYDALDYWARKECTENLQYRPSLDKGKITKPTCNWGFGCVTCWERHETYENKLQENYCD